MSKTNGNSELHIVCISAQKEERGFDVISSGEKGTNLLEIEIKVENSKLNENGTLETENGNKIINFADYKMVKENNIKRLTKYAIAKRKKEQKRIQEENVI